MQFFFILNFLQAKVEYQNVMVQLMEERVQNSATVSEYKQVSLKIIFHIHSKFYLFV